VDLNGCNKAGRECPAISGIKVEQFRILNLTHVYSIYQRQINESVSGILPYNVYLHLVWVDLNGVCSHEIWANSRAEQYYVVKEIKFGTRTFKTIFNLKQLKERSNALIIIYTVFALVFALYNNVFFWHTVGFQLSLYI
jgi:hypothetical protein